MPIQRSGPVPEYLEYVINYGLCPRGAPLGLDISSLVYPNFSWIDIPSYQRGISWSISDVMEFLESDSILLGNVIFGDFPLPPELEPNFPADKRPNRYSVLVDGLQRFAVGTALLSILHNLVIKDSPDLPQHAGLFLPLKTHCASLSAIYLHNDQQLLNHTRNTVAAGYLRLRNELSRYVEDELSNNAPQLSTSINNLFFNKQIAIDLYFNFSGPLELMNTFLGINTVRVDLSPVDLLRANVIERAQSSGWSSSEIQDTENSFTDTFMDRGGEKPKTELLPFVSIVLKYITNGNGHRVFPSWSVQLDRIEVSEFLDFIDMFLNCSDDYVFEIRNCGTIPFACLIGYYYNKLVTSGHQPSFFQQGGIAEHGELHAFLCANYRAIIAGKIGKTKDIAQRAFDGVYTDLTNAAEAVSQNYVGTPLNSPLGFDWLKSSLQLADINRSRRIFNAMLLGDAQHSGGQWGSAFVPMRFGRSSVEYNIDHLIPLSMKINDRNGAREIDTIKNFSPLRTNLNTVARATSCSVKLGASGIYSNSVITAKAAGSIVHPYWEWLIQTQSQYGPDLDNQVLFEPNSSPDIGTQRIEWISDFLIKKI